MQESRKYELRNGIVYKKHNNGVLFYVPEDMTRDVIRVCHNEVGHVGPEKTIDLIQKVYWFPGMREQVRKHIENCVQCLAFSVPSGKSEGELHLYDKGSKPLEAIHIDHYGPLA